MIRAPQSVCVVRLSEAGNHFQKPRELTARGHDVRLLPAQYVKPYLKRQKNDAADAEAICEVVTRPTMRFVPVKSPEQQSVMMLHRLQFDAQPPAHADIERVAGTPIRVRDRSADRAE
ncbi:hypothetical protein [Mesorhizobium sp. INR15]|uniref:hypothetical protein n=1 Tax=Mesorhizobium sp. INR15 TaxID=2654248 RepID=UPI0035BC014B